jgi:WD40 repeat protein
MLYGLSAGVAALCAALWYFVGGRDDAYLAYRGHNAPVHAVAFDDKGELVASGAEDGLHIWRTSTGREVWQRDGFVQAVRFVPGTDRLVYADAKAGVVLLNVRDGTIVRTFGRAEEWITFDISRDGKWLAVSSSPSFADAQEVHRESFTIRLWNLDKGGEPKELPGHEGPVIGLAFHPTKPLLVSVSQDLTRRIWDLNTGMQIVQIGDLRPLSEQPPFTAAHIAVAFGPNGDWLLLGGTIYQFPGLERKVDLWKLAHPYVVSGSTSPDGVRVATGHEDGSVRIWDMKARRELASIRAFRNQSAVFDLEFSPDGRFLVTCGEGRSRAADLASDEVVRDTTVRVWQLSDVLKGE